MIAEDPPRRAPGCVEMHFLRGHAKVRCKPSDVPKEGLGADRVEPQAHTFLLQPPLKRYQQVRFRAERMLRGPFVRDGNSETVGDDLPLLIEGGRFYARRKRVAGHLERAYQ